MDQNAIRKNLLLIKDRMRATCNEIKRLFLGHTAIAYSFTTALQWLQQVYGQPKILTQSKTKQIGRCISFQKTYQGASLQMWQEWGIPFLQSSKGSPKILERPLQSRPSQMKYIISKTKAFLSSLSQNWRLKLHKINAHLSPDLCNKYDMDSGQAVDLCSLWKLPFLQLTPSAGQSRAFKSCNALGCPPDITEYIERLRVQNIHTWENENKAKAIMCFTHLALIVKTLESTGVFSFMSDLKLKSTDGNPVSQAIPPRRKQKQMKQHNPSNESHILPHPALRQSSLKEFAILQQPRKSNADTPMTGDLKFIYQS